MDATSAPTVLMTGATAGIGKAAAVALADRGARWFFWRETAAGRRARRTCCASTALPLSRPSCAT